eukprot:1199234-Pleurochrysis_carterae.AAC.2
MVRSSSTELSMCLMNASAGLTARPPTASSAWRRWKVRAERPKTEAISSEVDPALLRKWTTAFQLGYGKASQLQQIWPRVLYFNHTSLWRSAGSTSAACKLQNQTAIRPPFPRNYHLFS